MKQLLGAALAVITLSAQSPATPPAGEWRSYAGDLRNHHYSPLSQVNGANFQSMEVAWRFKTDSLGPIPEFKLEGTPLMINGVLYTTGGSRRAVVALDAATGELIWVHSEREGARAAASPRQLSGRGVAYWTDPSTSLRAGLPAPTLRGPRKPRRQRRSRGGIHGLLFGSRFPVPGARLFILHILRQALDLIEEQHRMERRDFEFLPARLAHHVIVQAQQVIAQLVELGSIVGVAALRWTILLGPADVADAVLIRALAPRAGVLRRTVLGALAEEGFLV